MSVDPVALRAWLEIAVAVLVLLGASKSAYNGYVGRVVRGLMLVPALMEGQDDIREQLDDQRESLDDQRDALVGLTWAHEEEHVEMDPIRTEEELGKEEGVRRFLKNDDENFLRGGSDD